MRVLLIDWIDAQVTCEPWTARDSIDAKPVECRSIGFVVKESDEGIALCLTDCPDFVGGNITIPKINIINMWEITFK